MDQRLDHITQKIDDSAITRYKRRLDKKYPIRARDLRFPGRSALLGCIWTKFALVLVITAFLIMHSMGLDDGIALEEPLAPWLIVSDIAVGFCVYALISLFTYCYLRIKNPAFAIILFVACCAVVLIAFLVWGEASTRGGFYPAFSITLIIICLVPFIMDIWGFITYDQKVAQGKML